MSDPKPQNKSKNKKKKSKSTAQANVSVVAHAENLSTIPVKLPQNANETTYINEVQVTLSEKKENINEKVVPTKKNKGSKKHVNVMKPDREKEDRFETVLNTNALDSESSLLSFSRGGNVELKNLPEITVTQSKELIASSQSAESMPEEQAVNDVTATTTSKKKKKKKKKKNAVNQEKNSESNENVTNIASPDISTNSEPTYVKLPTTGDACVLVVSHESFGSNDTSRKKDANASNAIESIGRNSSESKQLTSNSSSIKTSEVTMIPSVRNIDSPLVAQAGVSIIPSKSVDASLIDNHDKDSSKIEVEGNKANDEKFQKSPKTAAKDSSNEKSKAQGGKQAQDGQKNVKSEKPLDLKQSTKASAPDISKGKQMKITKNKKINLVCNFAHLPPYKSRSVILKHLESKSNIHQAIVAVGAQCAEGIISGSNARCVAVLVALKEVIRDYKTPLNKELSRDLDLKLQECVNFISKCRPLSICVTNAVKVIKKYVNNVPTNVSDDEAKTFLFCQIDKFIKEEIILAKKAISSYATDKIVDGDVILTYGYSSVVKDALCEANEQQKSFRVVVVDSFPRMEGRHMLKSLYKEGINCSYVLISGISYAMMEATKVIIGAHALQANGYVISRVGASKIALVASFYNVPFLVCCETYKFCEKAHTDSFVYNELGDPESFEKIYAENSDLENWKDMENLRLLYFLYDITLPHLVSMCITEKGMLPCSSAPVVLRVRHSGTHD